MLTLNIFPSLALQAKLKNLCLQPSTEKQGFEYSLVRVIKSGYLALNDLTVNYF
ncbi:MAG: hypothetical protein V7L25_30675 [Nostoc sp.]|uniref:hypothetical protein n=1 Tax=Nostoc sp. TaxID=1180 RepID=UPI002FF03B94